MSERIGCINCANAGFPLSQACAGCLPGYHHWVCREAETTAEYVLRLGKEAMEDKA